MATARRSPLESFFSLFGTLGIVASLAIWSTVVSNLLTSHMSCPTGTTMLMVSCGKVVDGVVVYVDKIEARTDEQRLLDQAMLAQVQFYALVTPAITLGWWVFAGWVHECRRPSLAEPSKVSPEVSVV